MTYLPLLIRALYSYQIVFIRELKGYPSDSVVIPVETVDGKRLIVLDKDKAHEIMRAFKDRI
jgi:HSP90 family molecular chaperone